MTWKKWFFLCKIVGSSTGEGTSTTLEERKAITEEWVKAVKLTKQHLMVQVGGAPLPHVLELVCYFQNNFFFSV